MTETIYFYSEKDPHYEFSNYFMIQIIIDGKTYPSSEHYYQAQKYLNTNPSAANVAYAELIRTASTANKARVLAQQKIKGGHQAAWYHSTFNRAGLNDLITQSLADGVTIRSDWEQVKDDVMRVAVAAKFSQHPHLKTKLLNTQNAPIAEKSPIDGYWGLGADGKGQNRLGQILMEQRTKFLTQPSPEPKPEESEPEEPKPEEPKAEEPEPTIEAPKMIIKPKTEAKSEPKSSGLTFRYKAI